MKSTPFTEGELEQKPDTQSRELSFYSVEELEWLLDHVIFGNCANATMKQLWVGRINEAITEARERENGLPF